MGIFIYVGSMANRRMFCKDITESDAFLCMPLSTQSLYFHLGMNADDDWFLWSAKKILRMIGASEDDFKLLVMKRFILIFGDWICVIKHWKMNNQIRADRYKPTCYTKEMSSLKIKENGSYTELHTIGIPNGNQMETQYSIVEGSVVEESQGEKKAPKGATVSKRFVKPTLGQVQEYCESRNNSIESEAFLAHYDAVGWVYGKDRKPVRDWKACVRTREQKRKEEQKAKEPQTMDQRVLLYEKMWHVPFRTKYWSEKATEVKIYSL